MKFLHAHRSFLFKTEKVYIIEKQDGERDRERERKRVTYRQELFAPMRS